MPVRAVSAVQPSTPTPASLSPKQASIPELVAIASLLMATVALSVDIMLPALDDMARELGAAAGNDRQHVILALFAGFTLGQLVFGPLSDSVGRRPSIFAGVALYVLGSAVCASATSFETLIAGRVLQGVGAAGPRIVTVALIRDRLAGAEMARVMSLIMGLFIMVPVLAPALGQLLLFVMPWRGLFVVLSVLCVTAGVWLALRQGETLEEPRALRPGLLGRAFLEVLTSAKPMLFTVAGGCCYGALMGYINASQQIFQDLFDVGDRYVVLFGASAAFISSATLINSRLVKRFRPETVCRTAVAVQLIWTIPFALVAWLAPDEVSLRAWLVFLWPTLFLLGLTFGNFNAIALNDLGHVAGLASGVIASLTTALSTVIAGAVGLRFDMSVVPIVAGFGIFGALALASMSVSLVLESRKM